MELKLNATIEVRLAEDQLKTIEDLLRTVGEKVTEKAEKE